MKKRDTNVLSLLEDKTNIYARKTALGMKTNFGWRELTYDGLGLMSRRLASYLINDLGIQKEEKMAILSESKPEFGVCVLGSVIAGTITVPLDIKLTIYELTSILSDCMPSVMLVSLTYLDKALELQKAVPQTNGSRNTQLAELVIRNRFNINLTSSYFDAIVQLINNIIMQASPTTQFVSFSQAILFRGAGIAVVWKEFLALFVIGGILFGYSLIHFCKSVT